jgi:uncharacterized phiE125 gp8 family phage protein
LLFRSQKKGGDMNYAPKNRVWSVAALTTSCVTMADMQAQVRGLDPVEATLMEGYILAAQSVVEKRTQRLLSRRAVTLRLPGLPFANCPVELPGGEVASITSVTADGAAVTGTTAFGDSPAVLLPADEWPAVTGEGYPVTIIYQAGFAPAPADLKAAVMLLAADLFENRANSGPGPMAEVPLSAQMLMEPWRIRPI